MVQTMYNNIKIFFCCNNKKKSGCKCQVSTRFDRTIVVKKKTDDKLENKAREMTTKIFTLHKLCVC